MALLWQLALFQVTSLVLHYPVPLARNAKQMPWNAIASIGFQMVSIIFNEFAAVVQSYRLLNAL